MMLNTPSLSTSIIATSVLLFSLNVNALTTDKTPLIETLPTSNCIADSVISAAELSDTRDNSPFSVAKNHVPRQLANGFGGGTIHYPTDAGGCGSARR